MAVPDKVVSSHPIPRVVSSVLQQSRCTGQSTAGFSEDGKHCWAMADGQLLLWQYTEGVDARLTVLRLPAGVRVNTQHHVAVLTMPASQTTTVVICTPSGLLMAWLNISHLAEPLMHQVPINTSRLPGATAVAAFAAVGPSAPSGVGLVAVLANTDGSLFIVKGSQQGMHSQQLCAGSLPSADPAASRGMLNTLGQVLAWTYTEAFDPGSKLVKRSPSGRAGVAVAAIMVDVHHLHAYVLTESTLDCWQVTIGLRPSQQLLWSSQTVMAANASLGLRLQGLTNVAMAVDQERMFIWMMDCGDEGIQSHWVHKMALLKDALPVHLECLPVLGMTEKAGPPPGSSQCRLHASATAGAVLMVWPDMVAYEWLPGQHATWTPGHDNPQLHAAVVTSDVDTVALSCAPQAAAPDAPGSVPPGWLLLNATYGVLQLACRAHPQAPAAPPRAQPPPRASPTVPTGRQTVSQPAQQQAAAVPMQVVSVVAPAPVVVQLQGGAPLSAEQQTRVHQLLDSVLAQAAAVVAQQQPLLTVAVSARHRLDALGALSSTSATSVLASYSTSLVDALPKQWSTGGMGVGVNVPAAAMLAAASGVGGAGLSLLHPLLAAKEAKHGLLLQLLADAGVLHALPPSTLRVLVENAEKLAAAGAVLALHSRTLEEQPGGVEQPPLLVQVVAAAGQRLAAECGGSDSLAPVELVYARPSGGLPALLRALGDAGGAVREQAGAGLARPGDASAQELCAHVRSLGQLLGVVVAACQERRDVLQVAQRLLVAPLYGALGQPPWLATKAALDALDELALSCQAVRSLLLANHTLRSSSHQQLALVLFGCTEVLLSGFAAAVAASPDQAAKAEVLLQYQAARDRCMASLLEDAFAEVEGGAPLTPSSLLPQVEALAAAHHCYAQLFPACERLDALESGGQALHQRMATLGAEDGAGELDTFARYAYQRLLAEQRPADLLQLPTSFHDDLAAFLGERPAHAGLLWPLQLQRADWASGARAVVQDAEANKGSLSEHRRLCSLARLGAAASGDVAMGVVLDRRLNILAVQEELLGLQPHLTQQLPGLTQGAMEEADLVQVALAADAAGASGQGALLALRALGACAEDVQQANRSKLSQAWQQLLQATDWQALHVQYSVAGATEAWASLCKATPLYQATVQCCASGLLGQTSAGVNTAPVQEVAAWLQALTKDQDDTQYACLQCFQLGLEAGA